MDNFRFWMIVKIKMIGAFVSEEIPANTSADFGMMIKDERSFSNDLIITNELFPKVWKQ